MNRLVKELDKIECEYVSRFPMSRYTSMRVGGIVDLIVYPKNQSELIMVFNILRCLELDWTVLGGGSNTIIDDGGIKGVLVSTRKMRDIQILENGKVLAEAGAVLGTILNNSLRAGLSGFEFAAGIPGTVGGGIAMNAGANDGEIKDVVERVWIWLDGKEIVLSRDEINFEYRKNDLPKGSVVTRALFFLTHGNRKESEKRVKDYLDKRSKTQPITTSNSGSIFKNPAEIPAGKLLEELGFKGFTIGGARFSELHANFIVNSGSAKASDVIRLIQMAGEEAFLRKGLLLETEVKIIGKEKS
ncbi:MAG: UDP-N-acetylmuramate dehydrogenase [Deltaproteobacteria bacterium]|nr:UDP-N-acetylmuramate dehydrogenase [Deltaproteobacteria bacterium]